MARIRPPEQKELTESMVMLNKLVKELKHTTSQESLEKSLHKELTYIVDSTTEICSQLHKDYFDPEIPEEIPEELDPASSSILAQ